MAKYGITGYSTNAVEVDANRNVLVSQGYDYIGAAGGHYMTTGFTSAVVAASLANSTTLMSMRMATSSSRRAYITHIRVKLTVATVGTSALVAGTLGFQRFYGATPTGGTARTAVRKNAAAGTTSDVTDIRDSNAALTVTGVTFTDIYTMYKVPILLNGSASSTTGVDTEWFTDLDDCPIVLGGGDGLCLRTQVVMPATQTWGYSYNIHWYEV